MQVNHAGFTQIVGSPTSATHVAEGMQRPCARALNTFRFDPSTGTLGKTPINVPKLFNYLPDCWEKTFILIGFKFGFNLQYNGTRSYRELGGR